jgi:hypothetical protein
MVDQRHRPVGIDLTAATAWVEPLNDAGDLHKW